SEETRTVYAREDRRRFSIGALETQLHLGRSKWGRGDQPKAEAVACPWRNVYGAIVPAFEVAIEEHRRNIAERRDRTISGDLLPWVNYGRKGRGRASNLNGATRR